MPRVTIEVGTREHYTRQVSKATLLLAARGYVNTASLSIGGVRPVCGGSLKSCCRGLTRLRLRARAESRPVSLQMWALCFLAERYGGKP